MTAFEAKSFDTIAEGFEPGEDGLIFEAFFSQLQESFLCVAEAPALAQQIAILKFKGGEKVKRALTHADPQLLVTDLMATYKATIAAYFEPAYTPIFCAYKMNRMSQREEESIDMFVDRLTRLSKSTTFDAGTREKEIIKSLALNSTCPKLTTYILSHANPTLPDVLKKGRIYEKLVNELKIMAKSTTKESAVCALGRAASDKTTCSACGMEHATNALCIATSRTCYNCGVVGHLSRQCREPRRQQQTASAYNQYAAAYQSTSGQDRPNQQFRAQNRPLVQEFRKPSVPYAARPYSQNAYRAAYHEARPYSQNAYRAAYHEANSLGMGEQHRGQSVNGMPAHHFSSSNADLTNQNSHFRSENQHSLPPMHLNDMPRNQQNNPFGDDVYTLNEDLLLTVSITSSSKSTLRSVKVNGHAFIFLLDTGASVNVLTRDSMNRVDFEPLLRMCQRLTYGYNSNKPLNMEGEFEAKLTTSKRSTVEYIQVLNGIGRNILGLTAATALGLIIIPEEEINSISEIESVAEKFPKLFSNKIGLIKNVVVKLNINESVKPVVSQCRRLPYHDIGPVTKELNSMIDQQILELVPPFTPTPWVSPMMIVKKKDGTPRVCIDSRAINTAIEMEYTVMKTIEDIRYEINGAERLSKIDLNKAYFQFMLAPESQYITAFITQIGLLRYKRMFMGMNTASAIFQREIAFQLRGLAGVLNVSDDILVHGSCLNHDERLDRCLKRLQDMGATAGIAKCKFNKKKIKFFGMMFSGDGMAPTRDRVRALRLAKQPETPSEIRSILGMVNFSAGFIKDLATMAEPLRAIGREGAKWIWGDAQVKSWNLIKNSLTTRAVAHFNINWLSQIVVDASPVGMGAILQQINPDNRNDTRIINFSSKKLNEVEILYPHIEKEAKACVYGCEKNHLYVASSRFNLITDNKPVELLFKNPASVPSARIQKMAVRLAQYQFTIIHKPGYYNEADFLSRRPLENSEQYEDEEDCDSEDEYENEIMESHINAMVSTNIPNVISRAELVKETMADKEISLVKLYLIDDERMPDHLKAFQAVRHELTVTDDGLLIRLFKVVIPATLRLKIIKQAHAGHQGQTKTLSLLSTSVWFPAARAMVDLFVSQCKCQVQAAKINPPPLRMNPLPSRPFEEVSMDFYSISNTGIHLFTMLCQYSRFPFVLEFTRTTAAIVIPKINQIFAQFGYPIRLRSDNGPPFNSYEFADYLRNKGITHIKTIPASPSCNGQCENFNKVLTKVIRLAKLEQRAWRVVLEEALLNYRTTPHSTTGYAPASLMFNRNIQGILPIVMPQPMLDFDRVHAEVVRNDSNAKTIMKSYADERRHAKPHIFKKGDLVRVIQESGNKLSTKFNPDILEIILVEGVKITAVRVNEPDRLPVIRHASQFTLVNVDQNDLDITLPGDEMVETEIDVTIEGEQTVNLPARATVAGAEIPNPPDITEWEKICRALKKTK